MTDQPSGKLYTAVTKYWPRIAAGFTHRRPTLQMLGAGRRRVAAGSLLVLACLSGPSAELSAQVSDVVEQDISTTPRAIVGAAFRYQNLIDEWDIAYFGLTGEVRVSDKVSFSGSIFLGEGPDNTLHAHLPAAGFVAMIPIALGGALIEWIFKTHVLVGEEEDEEEAEVGYHPPSYMWKLLLMENTHYNIRVSETVVLSPYVNFLSLDSHVTDPSVPSAFSSLSSGLGLNAKIFRSDRFVLIPDIVAKYVLLAGGQTFRGSGRLGYALTLHAGYVF